MADLQELKPEDVEGAEEIEHDDGKDIEEVDLLGHDDEEMEQQHDSSLLEDNSFDGAVNEAELKEEVAEVGENFEGAAGEEAGDKEDEEANAGDEDEAEEAKHTDPNEMPQVNIAALAKRKWQVKVYPLRPDDFMNGQISRVFSNARESLLYLLSSGRSHGGKGEMYASSAIQASRVVQNLMKLDFRSPHINIEIIKKNDKGDVEEKAFMRFDAKLVRILCVPLQGPRRIGSKRERIIGSIFVKNLPISASKDMLRVMFPFAPEINYNPEKFPDGTARLVLSTRSAVAPCLKAFVKVEHGDTKLELRPLQKRVKSTDDEKISTKEGSDSAIKTESKEEDSKKSDSEGKASGNKEEKGSTKKQSEKRDSSAQKQNKVSSTKSTSASKSSDVNKEKSRDRDSSRTGSGRSNSTSNRRGRDQGDNKRWKNLRDNRGGDRNRPRGGFNDRNRFRTGSSFGNRNRLNDRRVRPGLAGSTGDVVNTEATKDMIILQSQLSMAIKNQLSMLNQTQFALEQAKRGAASFALARDVAQASSSGLLSKQVADPYGSQLSQEQGVRGQLKVARRRTRGRARDRRGEDRHSVSMGGDYGYKRNAGTAGLGADYESGGYGKRRSAGLSGRSEGPSWADEAGYGHQSAPLFAGYEHEVVDREADYLQSGGLSQSGLNYSQYGYRY